MARVRTSVFDFETPHRVLVPSKPVKKPASDKKIPVGFTILGALAVSLGLWFLILYAVFH